MHINDQTNADHPGIPMGGMFRARFDSIANLDEIAKWQRVTSSATPAHYQF